MKRSLIFLLALAGFLMPSLSMAQTAISSYPGFELNSGFDTTGIESPGDMHEPEWTEWIVTQMGLPAERGKFREVKTRAGKWIDILTCCEAVEVEWALKWYESIGQSIFYGIETNRCPAVILLSHGTKAEEEEIDNCKTVCARAGIRLYVQRVPEKPLSAPDPRPAKPDAQPQERFKPIPVPDPIGDVIIAGVRPYSLSP